MVGLPYYIERMSTSDDSQQIEAGGHLSQLQVNAIYVILTKVAVGYATMIKYVAHLTMTPTK